MFGAFIDESYDSHNLGFYAVSAIFGDGWDFLKADCLWHQKLRKHGISVFKSSSFRRRPDVVADFAQAIIESGLLASSYLVKQPSFRERLNETHLHKQYRQSPYMLLYQTTFVGIAMALEQRKSPRGVSFVCDENLRYKDILLRSYEQLRELNPTAARCMGSLTTDTDEKCIPLQMADLIASETRRAGTSWEKPDLSEPLHRLVEAKVIWRVGFLDESSLDKVRNLVA